MWPMDFLFFLFAEVDFIFDELSDFCVTNTFFQGGHLNGIYEMTNSPFFPAFFRANLEKKNKRLNKIKKIIKNGLTTVFHKYHNIKKLKIKYVRRKYPLVFIRQI